MFDSLTLETLLAALYQATWQAMLIALVAWSLTYFLRKQLPPRWRVVFWSLPLFRTLLISLPICSISLYGIFDSSLAGLVNVDLRDRSYTPTNPSTVSPIYTQLDPNPIAQPTFELPTQPTLPSQPRCYHPLLHLDAPSICIFLGPASQSSSGAVAFYFSLSEVSFNAFGCADGSPPPRHFPADTPIKSRLGLDNWEYVKPFGVSSSTPNLDPPPSESSGPSSCSPVRSFTLNLTKT